MAKPVKRDFSLDTQAEVFPTTTATSAAIRREVTAGRARKLAGRLYTRNMELPLERVALRNWQRIAKHYFPDGVIADRSALEAKPAPDGSLFLDAGPRYAGRGPTRVPGLTLVPRRGPGPVTGDMPYMGLHLSATPRAMLDNLRSGYRVRQGASRTVPREQVENELIRIAARQGPGGLNELRDKAQAIAPKIDAEREMKDLDELIGTVLGTRDAPLESSAARARRDGIPYDTDRIELFAALQTELIRDPRPERPAQPHSWPALSFFEAYFSNWIEGTEFEVSEAEEIVLEGRIPANRFEDAHDVLGTFELVDDPVKRSRVPDSADELIEQLRSSHAEMLGRRPAVSPGSFKERANQAGGTAFVAPELVLGTLREGFAYLEPLSPGFAQAIFMMFLVSEVHPFVDGNGRVGRTLMNAALSSVDQQRIVIPLSFRDDYLDGLRALSRGGNPKPLVRALDRAQRYAAGIDWSDLRVAEGELRGTNAFVSPDEARAPEKRLRLPAGAPD